MDKYYGGYLYFNFSSSFNKWHSLYIYHEVKLTTLDVRWIFQNIYIHLVWSRIQWLIKRQPFSGEFEEICMLLFMVSAQKLGQNEFPVPWNGILYFPHTLWLLMPNAIQWKMVFGFHVSIVALFFSHRKVNMTHPFIILFHSSSQIHDWIFFQQHSSMTDWCQIQLWMLFFCFVLVSAFQNSDACHVNYMFALETKFHILPVQMNLKQNVRKPFIIPNTQTCWRNIVEPIKRIANNLFIKVRTKR